MPCPPDWDALRSRRQPGRGDFARSGAHLRSRRRRFNHSRLNLIRPLPSLSALRVYDNSAAADPAKGQVPVPILVLRMDHGKITGSADLRRTPGWAKPIVAAALKLQPHY